MGMFERVASMPHATYDKHPKHGLLLYENHYTGRYFHFENTGEWLLGRWALYIARERNWNLRMVRLCVPGLTIGVHTGRGNYIKGKSGGFECFAYGYFPISRKRGRWIRWFPEIHFGWVPQFKNAPWWRVDYSGSWNDPYHSFTIRVKSIGFGGESPKWLIARKEREQERYWREMEDPPEAA